MHGKDERGRHSRKGRKGVLVLLFVLAGLGILLVEAIEVLNKCEQLPAQEHELVPEMTLAAGR